MFKSAKTPTHACTRCSKNWRSADFSLLNPHDFNDNRRSTICDHCLFPTHPNAEKCRAQRKKRLVLEAQYGKEPVRKAVNLAYSRRRRIQKHNACPEWANEDAIRHFYLTAKQLTAETGIPHDVDHIVPLKHKAVCGLHVPANLQILTARENRRKSNKFIVK
jgi:hypothetical protein